MTAPHRTRRERRHEPTSPLAARPHVGHLTVPYMVDATRTPIDFKALDAEHVTECATRTRCGICGGRIRRGPIAFIGPDDGRTCFADPWMHPACAQLALEQCPFIAGRRDWREPDETGLLRTYSDGMVAVFAKNWRSHRDPFGAWHFEAIGGTSPLAAPTVSSSTPGADSPESAPAVGAPPSPPFPTGTSHRSAGGRGVGRSLTGSPAWNEWDD